MRSIPSRRTVALVVALLAGLSPAIAAATPALAIAAQEADELVVAATDVSATPVVVAPDVPAAGGAITVTGSGFAVQSPGIYLSVGPVGLVGFYEAWAAGKLVGSVTWIGPGNPVVEAGEQHLAPMAADGSFVVSLDVPAPTPEAPAYAIYTSKAHGAGMTDPSQDTVTTLTYAAEPQPSPEDAVATALTIAVATVGAAVDVTITVTPAAEGTSTLFDNGAVVATGLRLSPTTTASPAASASATTRLATLAAGGHSFSASFVPDDPTAFASSDSAAVVHTVDQDTTTPDTTTPDTTTSDANASDTQPAAGAAAEPVCVARAVSGATFDWGVKSSFRSYISGGIASGSWTLDGVTDAGGSFGWSGGTGSINADETRGLVRFPGTVSFSGHGGVLTLVLSNLALRVTGSTAIVIADVHGTDMSGAPSAHSGVNFATVALGGSTASGSVLAVEGASATLTTAGAAAFAGFYPAGTALDPVSFRLPLGATVACDSTTAATASSLASTGSGGTGAGLLVSGLLVLVGVVAVVAMHRRTTRTVAEAR